MCGIGGGEGDAGGSSDSVEDFGFASVVARFCICVEEDSYLGGGSWQWLKNVPGDLPHGCSRKKSLSQG